MRQCLALIYVLLLTALKECHGAPRPPVYSSASKPKTNPASPLHGAPRCFDESTSSGRVKAFHWRMREAGINELMPIDVVVSKAREMIVQHPDPATAGRFASSYLRDILSSKGFKEYRRQQTRLATQPSKDRAKAGLAGPRSVEVILQRAKVAKDLELLLASKGLSFEMEPIDFARKIKTVYFDVNSRSLQAKISHTVRWKERHEGFDIKWRKAYTRINALGPHTKKSADVDPGLKRACEVDQDYGTEEEGELLSREARASRHPRYLSTPESRPILRDWTSLQRNRSMTDQMGKVPTLLFGYGDDHDDLSASSHPAWQQESPSGPSHFSSDDESDDAEEEQESSPERYIEPFDPITNRPRFGSLSLMPASKSRF
jgi:hypothetical protein